MAVLDHGVFVEWTAAFDNLERTRTRHSEAEKLNSIELLAYAVGEREKANVRYLSAVAALDA